MPRDFRKPSLGDRILRCAPAYAFLAGLFAPSAIAQSNAPADADVAQHLARAQQAAELAMIQLVQHQAYALALQDGYRVTFFLVIPAIVAVLFIPSQRIVKTKATAQGEPAEEGTPEEAMAAMA